MTKQSAVDRGLSPWMTDNLSGLAGALEAAMLSRAVLGELEIYHRAFEDSCIGSSSKCLYSEAERELLSSVVKRFKPLRDEILSFVDELGTVLLWAGLVCDESRYSDGSVVGDKCDAKKLMLSGFDRRAMLSKGEALSGILRQSQAAVAAAHIAAQGIWEFIDIYEADLSDAEEKQYDLLENFAYWAENDVDRIRSLLANYSRKLTSLSQAEPDTEPLTDRAGCVRR